METEVVRAVRDPAAECFGPTAISLRRATPADSEFCFQLHKAAMGPYVTGIWGWDERVQRDFHEREFNSDRWQIITADGADIGILIVEYRPTEVYLARIELHPDLQGRGIGAHLIQRLLGDADRRGQHVVLDVLSHNSRAQAFYQRHGFRAVRQHGEHGHHVTMRSGPTGRRPRSRPSTS